MIVNLPLAYFNAALHVNLNQTNNKHATIPERVYGQIGVARTSHMEDHKGYNATKASVRAWKISALL